MNPIQKTFRVFAAALFFFIAVSEAQALTLREKASPDACLSEPVEKQKCDRWYSIYREPRRVKDVNYEYGEKTRSKTRFNGREYIVLLERK